MSERGKRRQGALPGTTQSLRLAPPAPSFPRPPAKPCYCGPWPLVTTVLSDWYLAIFHPED